MKFLFLISLVFCLLTSCSKAGRRAKEAESLQSNRIIRLEKSTESIPVIKSVESEKDLTGIDIFERYNSAVFMIHTTDGSRSYQGSGFFVDKDGTAVSNYHVFKGTNRGDEDIIMSSGVIYKIEEVITYSDEHDYIIFKICGGSSFNFIPIEREIPQIGEKIYTIGSPLGLENTFSSGEVSQIRKNFMIQISAPIDHGSSGGALINSKGKAIGITTGGHDNSGANLNFAVALRALPLF